MAEVSSHLLPSLRFAGTYILVHQQREEEATRAFVAALWRRERRQQLQRALEVEQREQEELEQWYREQDYEMALEAQEAGEAAEELLGPHARPGAEIETGVAGPGGGGAPAPQPGGQQQQQEPASTHQQQRNVGERGAMRVGMLMEALDEARDVPQQVAVVQAGEAGRAVAEYELA